MYKKICSKYWYLRNAFLCEGEAGEGGGVKHVFSKLTPQELLSFSLYTLCSSCHGPLMHLLDYLTFVVYNINVIEKRRHSNVEMTALASRTVSNVFSVNVLHMFILVNVFRNSVLWQQEQHLTGHRKASHLRNRFNDLVQWLFIYLLSFEHSELDVNHTECAWQLRQKMRIQNKLINK